jgi:hypothetical protein
LETVGEVIAFKPKTGHRRPYLTPLSVTDAIIAFDDGERVEPFSPPSQCACVRGALRRQGENAVPSWKAVREQAKELRKKRGINWKEAADEIGVP